MVAAGGSKYAALISRFGVLGAAGDAEQQIGRIIHALLQRGLDDGTFRADLTVEELGFLLGQLLQAAARMTAEHVAGVEKAAALITSVFLHGTERRRDTTADNPAGGGLTDVQAFEGLASNGGDDLEVLIEVQDGQAG